MNPIPWILLLLPKRFRRYGYGVLFITTLIFGLMGLSHTLNNGDPQQSLVIIIIIGIFLLSYLYGWKKESR